MFVDRSFDSGTHRQLYEKFKAVFSEEGRSRTVVSKKRKAPKRDKKGKKKDSGKKITEQIKHKKIPSEESETAKVARLSDILRPLAEDPNLERCSKTDSN